MDSLSAFVNDITEFQIDLPLWLKIGIILVLIIILLVGGYFLKETFDISYLKGGFNWFIFVAVLNLITILVIFYYYGKKSNSYVGRPGIKGKKGKRGKKGTSVSCSYKCKNNLYIELVRKAEIICTLNTYTEEFKQFHEANKYFMNLIKQGNDIDYSSFLKNIILDNGKTVLKSTSVSQDAVDKYKTLLNPVAIATLLIKTINDDITQASEYTYGTIRSSVPKVGYTSLGNSVYGGVENFQLNSFVVSGDIMYPGGYNKLVSFISYNENTGDNDKYTLWKPISQSVNEPGFKGGIEKRSYLPLGDVCTFGINNNPKINDFAMVKDNCLEQVNSKDLKLVFIYAGNIETNLKNNNSESLDFTQSNTYLIENKIANDIEIFSVWRTPMNTFITNCNSQNNLTNDTVIFNILNNLDDALNEYGNISNEYKKWVQDTLSRIIIPQFTVALIYTYHFEFVSLRELIYYMNKYQSQVKEFRGQSFDIKTVKLGDLLGLIKNTKLKYDDYNKELIKKASISLRGTKRIVYDETREKYLPRKLLNIYDNIIAELDTLPVQIENANSLLDIVNYIIPNSLNGRIAVDSDGLAEGGIMLNPIQEMIIRLCKIIFPPNRPAYIIKDECLGTFARDNAKEDKISELTNEKNKYNKYIDDISKDYNRFQSQITNIKNYEDLAERKMGMLCGNIKNYMEKIHNLDMDEFTIHRIQGLINIYKEVNVYLEDIIINTPVN
jgi:hypothetical protein